VSDNPEITVNTDIVDVDVLVDPVNVTVVQEDYSVDVVGDIVRVSAVVEDTISVRVLQDSVVVSPVVETSSVVTLLGGQGPEGIPGPTGPAGTGGGGGSNGFEFQDYEKTGTYIYVGYEHADGRWYIYRRTITSNVREYAEGMSGYDWSVRGALSYV